VLVVVVLGLQKSYSIEGKRRVMGLLVRHEEINVSGADFLGEVSARGDCCELKTQSRQGLNRFGRPNSCE